MKKVFQTITKTPLANCLQAATASYFDLELETVPNFMLFGDEYWNAYYYYIKSLGYESMGWVDGLPPEKDKYYIVSLDFGPDFDYGHSVIYRNGKIEHDPHLQIPDQSDVDKISGYYEIKKLTN